MTEAARSEQALDALEAEITDLWGHISAATYRFLELVAEFDRAEGWGRHGVVSCAQWLNLKCGIGPVAARAKVRVARALETLPKVSAAFRCGQISYSKVRAITRVATPETEETLLNVALYGTATHVERLVRHYRQVERVEESRRANERHRERFLHLSYRDDDSVTIYAKLPLEVGALIEKALEAAAEVLYQDRRRTEAEGGAAEVGSDDGARDSAESSASACDRAEALCEGNDSAESSPDEPRAAPSREPAPASARPIDLSDPRDDERDSFGARRADALRLLAERFLADEAKSCPSSVDRYQVVVHVDQGLLAAGHASANGIAGRAGACDEAIASGAPTGNRRCELEDRGALAIETARRLACDASLVGIVDDNDGEPLNVGRKTRAISPALKRALKSRDGGCRFPGCDRTRFTEGHHVVHWAKGGETKLANLVTLCTFHHRLVHEGGFGLRVTDDGAFVFTRPDGRRITAGTLLRPRDFDMPVDDDSDERRFRGIVLRSSGAIRDLNAERGVEVRPPPGWHGERMDYGLAIEAMLWSAANAAPGGSGTEMPSG